MNYYQKNIQEQIYCKENVSMSLRQDFSELMTDNVAYIIHRCFIFQRIPIINNSLINCTQNNILMKNEISNS